MSDNPPYLPQYPWDEGDQLFASALNAAIANAFAISGATTVNVKNYGAKGDGTTDDTAALQNAANQIPSTGGVMLFPPGVYAVHTGPAVPSNTLVQGYGATLLAMPAGFYNANPLLTNQHNAATTLTDHDITVENMTFDYGSSGEGGAAHCIHFMMVRNVVVRNCTLQCRGAGDAVSLPGCYNTLVEGCSAYGFTNSCFDYWWNPRKGRLIGCYAETATSAQMVAWNPEPTTGPVTGYSANEFVMEGCQFYGTGTNAIPHQIEPLSAGNTVQDVVVKGNTFVNSYLVMRNATTGAVITGNVFDGLLGGPEAISIYNLVGGANAPNDFVVTGNVVLNPATVIGNEGVIRVYTNNAVVANNVVVGTTVPAIDVGSFKPLVFGNFPGGSVSGTPGQLVFSCGLGFGSVEASSVTDFSRHIDLFSGNTGLNTANGNLNYGAGTSNSHVWYMGSTQVAFINTSGLNIASGGAHFGSRPASSPTDLSLHLDLDAGTNGINFYNGNLNYVAGNGSHTFYDNGSLVAYINASGVTGTAVGSFASVQTGSSSGPTWTSGAGAPSSAPPPGSLYSRTGGSTGTRLYVSAGGGVWNPVAGV